MGHLIAKILQHLSSEKSSEPIVRAPNLGLLKMYNVSNKQE